MSGESSSRVARTLVSEFIERVWNRADLSALSELCGPSYTYQLGGQPPRDTAAMAQFLRAVHAAFPDWRVQVRTILAEGDSVAVEWYGEVTHKGTFHGIPATGNRISVSGINVYTITDGKIVREREEMDSLGMLQQLGAL